MRFTIFTTVHTYTEQLNTTGLYPNIDTYTEKKHITENRRIDKTTRYKLIQKHKVCTPQDALENYTSYLTDVRNFGKIVNLGALVAG